MEPKTFVYSRYKYTKNSQYKDSTYYRCSHSRQGCGVRLTKNGEKVTIRGEHTCEKTTQYQPVSDPNVVTQFIDNLATTTRLNPIQIYEKTLKEFTKRTRKKIIQIPTKKQITDRVRELRELRETAKQNELSIVLTPELSETEDKKPFLQCFWKGRIQAQMESTIIWARAECLDILRQNGPVFIDATFKVAPRGFVQCFIIMAFDRVTNVFVPCPCAYSLMTSKTEYMYSRILHEIIVLLDYAWSPSIVVIDFEKALVNAAMYEFEKKHIVGCFFHFKQALSKRMRSIKLPRVETKIALKLINNLVLIKRKHIKDAIEKIKSTPSLVSTRWNDFWKYFNKVWMKKFEPSLWNISNKEDVDMSSYTNNCIESYNGRIGAKFMNAHPTLDNFIKVIMSEQDYFIKHMKKIRGGDESKPVYPGMFNRKKPSTGFKKWLK